MPPPSSLSKSFKPVDTTVAPAMFLVPGPSAVEGGAFDVLGSNTSCDELSPCAGLTTLG